MAEGSELQDTLDELIRVTDGLIRSRVSFDTMTEYLIERIVEIDEVMVRKLAILLVLEVVKERYVE